jgi:glycerol uptake facilitator protein
MAPRANLAPVIIGLVVVAIGLSFGANAGYAINPAREQRGRAVEETVEVAGGRPV